MKRKKFFCQPIFHAWIHLKHYSFGNISFYLKKTFYLIVLNSSAFPQHLTMKQMDDDNIRIYIRESDKDIFYQLEDMRSEENVK